MLTTEFGDQTVLKHEIELNRDFHSEHEEALLAFLWTHQRLTKLSSGFFADYGLTDTQFNALMIIADYQADGIRQFELARRLLINRASTGTLIDVMEKKGWIRRRRVRNDRRAWNLVLTDSGHGLLASFKPAWYGLMYESMSVLSAGEIEQFTDMLNRFRRNFTACIEQNEEKEGVA
jgi:DNA-binding MarR family transcriptional regulator